ncbi:FAD/NAD(P)-binding domain-containing protein [Wolfiporia cocos MD-104 SS10]|uniref:FAD/NAD(P)-binding domain-containing protein n=1 Tax=Wolfiporia cocos (strain MD-104) TaxID=742152 RepID=A0A2H3JS61_WOLCO|nr:FAD/NAD(P)-binding domain-containing protein [Wolfiporia cocos MD-104 SS10]
MSDCRKRVAIIGGGQAGLVAYRHMINYPTLEPVIFDAAPSLGGIWSADHPYHRPLMTTNISRHACAFSDVPWPADGGRERKDVFQYSGDMGRFLNVYAQCFLRKNDIRLNTRVTEVDYRFGRWHVRSMRNGETVTQDEVFDYLIIATGFFSTPYIPDLPGINGSPVRIEHSSVFKNPDEYAGKTVAVVGGSLSAVEVSGALSPHASMIHHITSRPFYVLPLYAPVGLSSKPPFIPWNFVSYRRANLAGRRTEVVNPTARDNRRKHRYLQSLFPDGLLPSFSFDTSTPPQIGISDFYRGGTRTGVVQTYLARLASIDTNTGELVLSTGERINPPDVIILCTGYSVSLPYLSQSVLDAIGFQPENHSVPFLSHRLVLHPDMPNAGFVGMYRGSYHGIIELQARYLAALFSGAQTWPSEDEMRKGVALEESIREASSESGIQFPHGDYVGLFESYADLLNIPMSDVNYVVAANYPLTVTDGVIQIRRDAENVLALSERWTWVRNAIFRSWAGRWKFHRKIYSGRPEIDGRSGGIATFRMRPASILSTDENDTTKIVIQEYLYSERGDSVSATERMIHEQHEAVYRFDPAADVIAVWSVSPDEEKNSPDEGRMGRWHHDIENVSPNPVDPSWFEEQRDLDGWFASGSKIDSCTTVYKFVFSGAEELLAKRLMKIRVRIKTIAELSEAHVLYEILEVCASIVDAILSP